jgi:hypothetical protein
MSRALLTRRQLLASSALGAASLARGAAHPPDRMKSMDDVPGAYADIWRIPGRFTKNPDMVRLPSGKLMLVFCDDDRHWSEEISRITTLESTDGGATWGNPRVIAEADRRIGEERWVTPRLTLLRDGRLVIMCDHDDYAHAHEDQPSGIWEWESRDQGRTWSAPRLTGIPGIEPDRIIELSDGTLLVGSHMTVRDMRKRAQFVVRSTDGGKTWKDLTFIAKDPVHLNVEGGIMLYRSGELACVIRDNLHGGYPSRVSFSTDKGRTWSRPQSLPFAGDRPYVKELRDGRVLVTYRNVSGNRGTHAWLGDLHQAAGKYSIGGVHYGDRVEFERESLRIRGVNGATTKFMLMPPESYRSDIDFEARLRVRGEPNMPVGIFEVGRHGLRIEVCSDRVWMNRGSANFGNPASEQGTDRFFRIDMTSPHSIRLQVVGGQVIVSADGKPKLFWIIQAEKPLTDTYFGRVPDNTGDVCWDEVRYEAKNDTEPHFQWAWKASSGQYPDQYQIDHMLVLMGNPPAPDRLPDNGYSSFIEREDGSIYMVDYTTRGDAPPASHLYRVIFSPNDFPKGA